MRRYSLGGARRGKGRASVELGPRESRSTNFVHFANNKKDYFLSFQFSPFSNQIPSSQLFWSYAFASNYEVSMFPRRVANLETKLGSTFDSSPYMSKIYCGRFLKLAWWNAVQASSSLATLTNGSRRLLSGLSRFIEKLKIHVTAGRLARAPTPVSLHTDRIVCPLETDSYNCSLGRCQPCCHLSHPHPCLAFCVPLRREK